MNDIYRALFISDVHVSNRLPHAKAQPGTDVTDRLQQQIELLDDVGQRADAEGIQDIYILGDFYDKAVLDAVTLRESTKALHRLAESGRRVFIGAGNHEAQNLKGEIFVSEFIQHLSNDRITYIDKKWSLSPTAWLKFWWAPWGPLVESKELIEKIQVRAVKEEGVRHILLCHHSVDGCTAGGWKCDDGLDPIWLTEHFDAVLSGHFHDPQSFGTCGHYLGSPLQLNFGDVGGSRVYWDITFYEDASKDTMLVPCETFHSKFHQYEIDSADAMKHMGAAAPGDYVKYIVCCAPEYWTANKTILENKRADIAADGKYNVKIQHRPTSKGTARIEDVEGMTYEEMMSEFVAASAVGDLSLPTLEKIGREMLEAARKEATSDEA